MKPVSADQDFFRKQLTKWHLTLDRPMPWKGISNPYFIWLSEVILQQTRVEQGLAYYQRFTESYPTVKDLAAAPEDEVLKLWQGLGYYSRARNLMKAARQIVDKHDGIFPNDYSDILALPGVGPYTAAAIASFAYKLPHAVVDGNVQRVLSRFFDIATPIDSTAGKKAFAELAQLLLDTNAPDQHNQQMMDFGATHCTPRNPKCSNCPLKTRCSAFAKAVVDQRPVKQKKLKKIDRFLHYFDVSIGEQTLLRKRPKTGIWAGLYEFPLLETEQPIADELQLQLPDWLSHGHITGRSKTYKHVLSHQNLYVVFWKVTWQGSMQSLPEKYDLVSKSALPSFAVSRLMDLYIHQNELYL